MKTQAEIQAIINDCTFRQEWFVLLPKGDGFLLQLRYMEPDVDTKELDEQHARKWYISPHCTESEIVRTAFLACMVSAEHRVREHFLYKGIRVFGPHLDINQLMGLPQTDHRD